MRAAREREARDTTTGAEPASPRKAVPSPPGPRPGDVAREALLRAATKESVADKDADAASVGAAGPSVGAAEPSVAPAARPKTQPSVTAARPGDIAREALRAARTESRQARPEAQDKGAETKRRTGDPASPHPRSGRGRRSPDQDRGTRARDVRALLAGAFELPDAEPPLVPADEAGTRGEAPPAHPSSPPSSPSEPEARTESAPPTARVPRSMASPGRDGELRRTFPASTARRPEADEFAETWWGNAWVTALEEGALDAARLARGRAYAGHGHVDAITVTPGLVLAYVHGSRPRPYRVQVRVRTLSDGDWDRFLDAAAERPGHIAALLDKELPQSLADCGVPLLPGPGELDPHCSCPDSGHPCKHAAALCYQTARLLDEDPFVLLLLRGRGERELLDALSRRNAARAARAAQEQKPSPLPGIRARDALARRTLPPLPTLLPPPAHPEQPPTYPGVPGGPDPFALDQLATDAAARAHALLTTGRDPVADLTLWQDAVRLAAARPGSGLTATTRALYASLASATGRTPADLARAVAAWRQGGFEALSVLEEPWDPPAGRFDRARPLLLAADLPAFRPWRNHLTHPHGHAQLRLGHNGLWYAYESEPGHNDWWPRGTPDLDPVGALTGLGAPGDL
ncbi:hypothetical protein B1C81_01990 [Streptomyces sp. HG99]|nr:hypothetical protein B1C81_01990 [Streptomyces sp. HG99]